MAARRSRAFGTARCQICFCERYEDEQASCYCADCRDICQRISTGQSEPDADDLTLEEFAERHAQLKAHEQRIAADLEAGAA